MEIRNKNQIVDETRVVVSSLVMEMSNGINVLVCVDGVRAFTPPALCFESLIVVSSTSKKF